MAFVDQKKNSRQTLSVAGVVLVHVAIGYGFIVGLTNHFQKAKPWTVLKTYPVPPVKVPPPIERQKPVEVPATVDTIVDPPATPQGDPISIIPDTPPVRSEPVKPVAPITVLQRGVQVKGDRSSWVTTDDYPPESIRNSEEGRVEITVTVGTNGRVTSCQVSGSSGHPALDAAACRFYSKRARFSPAISSDGMAAEASYVDRVRWQLPKE